MNPAASWPVTAGGGYHWWRQVECAQRGVFHLGPYELQLGDPLGFFLAEVRYPDSDSLLIYPRVVQLPQIDLPRGSAGGTAPRRRPLLGVQPAASVRDYRAGTACATCTGPVPPIAAT